MWNHGWGGGWMMIGWIIGLAVLVFLVWMIARSAAGVRPGPGAPDENAEQILNKRYARGEIDDQQYQRMKEELQKR